MKQRSLSDTKRRVRGTAALVTVLVITWLSVGCSAVHLNSSPSAETGKLHHIGFVWLKDAGSAADRQKIIDAAHRFAEEIPEVEALYVGQPAESISPLIDSSYDVALTMVLKDVEALKRYGEHPVHQKAAEEIFLPLSRKILFYDFVSE